MLSTLWNKLGDNTFSLIYIAIAIAACWAAFSFQLPLIQILSISLIRVGIFTFTSTWLIKFLNGTRCNIYKEIFEEKNIAASILVSGILLGLSIVIAVSI